MKYLLGLILAFITVSASAQNKQAADVKSTLLKVFELCEDEQDVQLAKHIVYRGKDESRKWKDVCNPNIDDEYVRAKIIRMKIQKQFLPYKYEFGKFMTETESEGTWYIWETKFTKDGESKKMYFAFLKINGEYALGDID